MKVYFIQKNPFKLLEFHFKKIKKIEKANKLIKLLELK